MVNPVMEAKALKLRRQLRQLPRPMPDANEVPGVTVPESVLARMRVASGKGKEAAVDEGVLICREMLSGVRDRVQGTQISAPLGKVPVVLDVLRS